MSDPIIADYWRTMSIVRKWARIALDEHKAGNPWQKAATLAHEAHRYAIMIIS